MESQNPGHCSLKPCYQKSRLVYGFEMKFSLQIKVPQPRPWVAKTEAKQADSICSRLIRSPGLARVAENLEVADGQKKSKVAFVTGGGISASIIGLMNLVNLIFFLPHSVCPRPLGFLSVLLNMPRSPLPQGLRICYFFCPEYSSTHTLNDKLLLCEF